MMNPDRNYNRPDTERNCPKSNMSNVYAPDTNYPKTHIGDTYANTTNTNMGRNQRMNRKQLLDWVCMLGFCRDDMLLYLDTHPKDDKALAYYKECNDLYLNAEKSYEEAYGPLTIDAAGAENDFWDWGKMPLPWEGVK